MMRLVRLVKRLIPPVLILCVLYATHLKFDASYLKDYYTNDTNKSRAINPMLIQTQDYVAGQPKNQETKHNDSVSGKDIRIKLEVIQPSEIDIKTKYYKLNEKVINPIYNYTFILSNHLLCSDDMYMVVLIPSAAQNAERRQAIRDTFARFEVDTHIVNATPGDSRVKILTLFVLGLNENSTVNDLVQREFHRFNDMVVADFVDSYYNLTLKVLLGLRWIGHHCHSVKYVLKSDDDVFVHIPQLLLAIEKYPSNTNGTVFGHILKNKPVLKEGKWAISKSEYPMRIYPTYTKGMCYTLTGGLISKIVNTAQYMPYLHMEDVFITGVIASTIHRATLGEVYRPSASKFIDTNPSPCKFVRNKSIAQTNMSPDKMRRIWTLLNDKQTFQIEC